MPGYLLNLITVRTPRQLDALAIQTYLLGAIAGAVFLLLAAIIANAIKYEGGAHPKDPARRRAWFWVLAALALAVVFVYHFQVVAKTVAPNLQPRFMTINAMGSGIALGVYLLLGFIVSKIFSTGKLGNWFPSKR